MTRCLCQGGGPKGCLCDGTGYITRAVAADPIAELVRRAGLLDDQPVQLRLGDAA